MCDYENTFCLMRKNKIIEEKQSYNKIGDNASMYLDYEVYEKLK